MRPFFSFLAILFIILILSSCDTFFYQVYFKEDDLKQKTLAFIQSAEDTLDICVYNISDPDILRAIASLSENGVKVRVITDDSNRVFIEETGIVYDAEGLMHNKYMVADSEKVWFGSTNLSQTSLEEHENNVIISDDRGLVEAFESNFKQCYDGKFKAMRSPLEDQICFSPEEDTFGRVIGTLSKARKSVKIAMFAFTDKRIVNYLKVLSVHGVEIQVMLDRDWNLTNVYSSLEALMRFTNTQLDFCDALLHEKFLIVDDQILLTGSYNYTLSAESKNDEFLFETERKAIVEAFIDHFRNLRNGSDPVSQAPAGSSAGPETIDRPLLSHRSSYLCGGILRQGT